MRSLTMNLCALAALLAAPAFAPAQPSEGGPPPARVRVDAMRLERVESLRQVTGELRAVRRSLVATEEAGRVMALDVAEGDRVAQGDLLAHLDDRVNQLEVDRAQAETRVRSARVSERQADLEKARRDLSRLEDLRARASASQTEVDDARTELQRTEARLAEAHAELAVAESQLARARRSLEDMRILAPFAGRIVTRRTEVGQWLREGDAVVELVALDEIEAWIDIPERFVARLREPGARALVRVAALARDFEGEITQVVPAADSLSRVFPVRVRLKNTQDLMRPGMSATALVPTGVDMEALTAHKDAILRDEAGAYLYYDMGGRAALARVEELFPVGDRVAVRSRTLEPGALVVTEGNERLYPGQPLMIERAPAAAGADRDAPGSGAH